MNDELDSWKVAAESGDLKSRILVQVKDMMSRQGGVHLDFKEIAAGLAVPVEEVLAIFPTMRSLIREMGHSLLEALDSFVEQAVAKLPADASPSEKLAQVAMGYYEFSIRRPHLFYCIATEKTLPQKSSNSLFQRFEGIVPFVFTLTENCLREIGEETKGEDIVDSQIDLAVTSAWATIHGVSLLSSVGILRHLGAPIRKQIILCAIENFIYGFKRQLTDPIEVATPELVLDALDCSREASIAPEDVFKSATNPQALADARDEISRYGVVAISFVGATEEKHHNVANASAKFRNAMTHSAEVERLIDNQVGSFVNGAVFCKSGSMTPAEKLTKAAAGYLAWGLDNPDNFEAMVYVSTQSIVPTNFAKSAAAFDMGESFALMAECFTDLFLSEGAPEDPWLLFQQVLIGWATVHGFVFLCAHGSLSEMDEENQCALLSHHANFMLAGLLDTIKQTES